MYKVYNVYIRYMCLTELINKIDDRWKLNVYFDKDDPHL